MTANQPDLGSHVRTFQAAGGFTGFQNRAAGRTMFLTIAGVVVGFIPGLVVALIVDFVPALIIFPVIGGIVAFAWARRQTQEAAVTEARVHEGGVIFVDGRGVHAVAWQDVVSIEARLIQNVLGTPLVDVKGVTNHSYLLRTRDGTGFWLDDRIEDVAGLAELVVGTSGVIVSRMA